MSQPKQSPLNGGHHGPSVPPPLNLPNRRGGRYNPCGCCFKCVCGCIVAVFIIMVILGTTLLTTWLVYRPTNKLKFYAADASLTQFEFSTSNNTLYYNLALNITAENRNKHVGIYFRVIEAIAFYQGQRFASAWLDPFYQGRKNTTSLHSAFQGQKTLSLGSSQTSNYNQDKSSGIYNIDVKLYMLAKYRWGLKTVKGEPKVDCSLKIPLKPTGNSTGTFNSTRCGLVW